MIVKLRTHLPNKVHARCDHTSPTVFHVSFDEPGTDPATGNYRVQRTHIGTIEAFPSGWLAMVPSDEHAEGAWPRDVFETAYWACHALVESWEAGQQEAAELAACATAC